MASRRVPAASPRLAPRPTAAHVMPASRGFGGGAGRAAAVATTTATLARRVCVPAVCLCIGVLLVAFTRGDHRSRIQLRLTPVGHVLHVRIGRGQAQLEEIEGGAET